MRGKWTHTGLIFETGVKTCSVHMTFHCFGSYQNDPIFWWACVRISFRVVFKWYFSLCQNEYDEITLGRIFKRTCALSTISNESALIHFVLGNFFSDENLMPAWNFISVKMTNMKSIPDSFHFPSFLVNTSKEQTEHWSKIFHRNEISSRFEFISPLMWTYSYFKLYVTDKLITFSSCAML